MVPVFCPQSKQSVKHKSQEHHLPRNLKMQAKEPVSRLIKSPKTGDSRNFAVIGGTRHPLVNFSYVSLCCLHVRFQKTLSF